MEKNKSVMSAGIKVSGRMRTLLFRKGANGFLFIAESDNKNTDLFPFTELLSASLLCFIWGKGKVGITGYVKGLCISARQCRIMQHYRSEAEGSGWRN